MKLHWLLALLFAFSTAIRTSTQQILTTDGPEAITPAADGSDQIPSQCVQADPLGPTPDSCYSDCRFEQYLTYISYSPTIQGSCPNGRAVKNCPTQPPLCDDAAECSAAEWTSWSACDSSCGGGIQSRSQNLSTNCLLDCFECSTQYQSCNTQPCGYDCLIEGDWSLWSSCSVTCWNSAAVVVPQQTRTRAIVQGVAPGQLCAPTDYIQSQACPNLAQCPVDCVLSAWGDWSDCDVSCGCGTQTRERSIKTTPSSDGLQCDTLNDVQTCSCSPCPRSCELSEWSFAPCMGDCYYNISGVLEFPTRQITRYVIQEAIPYVQPNGCATPCDLSSTQFCSWLPQCDNTCQLSEWSEWTGNCSSCVPYGSIIPIQERFRSVAVYGSGNCGCTKDIRVCDINWCCEDCVVSSWSSWGSCDPVTSCTSGATSTTGTQTRTRTILQQPNPCGNSCPPLTQSLPCSACCPIDCKVSDWVMTTSCGALNASTGSLTEIPCGPQEGIRQWQRSIVPGTACGTACPNDTVKQEACYPRIPCCPQDCELSEWSFSPCFGCGKLSVAWKSRNITQLPTCGGAPCCDQDCAKFIQIHCPNPPPCPQVPCVYGSFGDWDACSGSCHAFNSTPNTQCRYALLASGPADSCPPNMTDCVECGTACCPVSCEVSAWGDWSACSSTCSEGLQRRQRQILTAPACGGDSCPPLTNFSTCNLGPCPVPCVVSEWSFFSLCPSCYVPPSQPGNSTRTRTILQQSSGQGAECPTDLYEEVPCKIPQCDRDCQVTTWSDWSACSVLCGDGFQIRTRGIAVTPTGQGMSCPPLLQTQFCHQDCPFCVYGPPLDLPCPVTCQVAGAPTPYFVRTRQSITLANSSDSSSNSSDSASSCPPTNEHVPCQLSCCPADCVITAWGPWGECIDGVRNRTRSIVSQPTCEGLPCPTCYLEKDNCPYVPPPNECEYGTACEDGVTSTINVSS